MFEGRKIKRLLTQLDMTDRESDRAKLISQVCKFGRAAFPYVVDAFRKKQLNYPKTKLLLAKISDKSLLDDLISLTEDISNSVRGLAKELIIKYIGEDAIPKLTENLQSQSLYLKMSAREILCDMKSPTAALKLISLFNTGNTELKKSVISILAETGGYAAGKLFISALKSKDLSIRVRAVRGLVKIKYPAAVDPLIEMLTENDPQVKKGVIDALSAIGDKRASRPILPFLKDNDIIVRQKSMECLCQIGSADIVPDILTLLRDRDVNVRRCAVEILNNMKDPKTADELIKAMRDSDWWVREIATDAMIEIKGHNIINAMITMLSDSDENIRRCAVEFFNKVVERSAVEPLIERLKDEDWWVREKAVTALGKLNDRRAVQPLAEMIEDEEVKWTVPSVLGKIGGKEAVEHILEFLKDNQKRVRIEALKTLSMLKEHSMIKDIEQALEDPDEEVRDEAVIALKCITGKLFKKGKGRLSGSAPAIWSPRRKSSEGSIMTEAILVVDLCDSTGIADQYGDQLAFDLTEILTNMSRPLAEREHFRYVKSTGDGFLLTFPKVKNSVRFAMDLLRETQKYNKTADESMLIDLRFSINFGETRVDAKGDRIGLAVNMAFRAEGVKAENLIEVEDGLRKEEIPDTNRILVTEHVINELKKMKDIKTRFLGLFDLKGIAGLHRIYEIIT